MTTLQVADLTNESMFELFEQGVDLAGYPPTFGMSWHQVNHPFSLYSPVLTHNNGHAAKLILPTRAQ
ncbi:MAG: hypothetical protein ACTHY5_02515 [Oceanisphaera sp.]|uniref:hypothetical protein n=1 Tax=Gammaproteobacteria TaxID=1236 RepID=UPI003F9A9F74